MVIFPLYTFYKTKDKYKYRSLARKYRQTALKCVCYVPTYIFYFTAFILAKPFCVKNRFDFVFKTKKLLTRSTHTRLKQTPSELLFGFSRHFKYARLFFFFYSSLFSFSPSKPYTYVVCGLLKYHTNHISLGNTAHPSRSTTRKPFFVIHVFTIRHSSFSYNVHTFKSFLCINIVASKKYTV